MRSILQKLEQVDEFLHGTEHFGTKLNGYQSYGRGVEQASGLGLWFASFALLTSPLYVSGELSDISTLFWGVMAFCVGFCQLYYNRLVQRVVFTLFAAGMWVSFAIHLFIEAGAWNLGMAAALPMGLFNFYVFGFVYNEFECNLKGTSKYEAGNLA